MSAGAPVDPDAGLRQGQRESAQRGAYDPAYSWLDIPDVTYYQPIAGYTG